MPLKLPFLPLSSASFIIYKEGGRVKAYNCQIGRVQYSDSDAVTVLKKATSLGGVIYVRNAEYLFTDTLVLSSPVCIIGEGPNTIFKLAPNINKTMIQSNETSVFQNFLLDGNRENQTQTPLYGIKVMGNNSLVENVWTKNVNGGGIVIFGNYCKVIGGYHNNNFDEDVQVANSNHNVVIGSVSYSSATSGNRAAFWIYQGSYNIYSYCIAISCVNGFMILPGAVGSNENVFLGCQAISCSNSGFILGTGYVNAYRNKISNCLMKNNGNYGLEISDYFVDTLVDSNIFTGNTSGAVSDSGQSTRFNNNYGYP